MKKYFYSNGIDKEGPVTLEELKQIGLEPKTLIWHDGLEDWKFADCIDEFKEILEVNPPPINDLNSNSEEEKKDVLQKKQLMFASPFYFEGRIRRTEYGISLIICMIFLVFLNPLLKTGNYPFLRLAYVPVYLFLWAQGAKRCHDLGNNGWWQLVPFYGLWMIFQNGEEGANRYGKNPKQ